MQSDHGASRAPRHIGIIMDGNGRWARQRGLARSLGHRQGAKRVGEIARYAQKLGVEYLTLYAFSTENWKRPREEIDEIMLLLEQYLEEAANYRRENMRVVVLGDLSAVSQSLRSKIEKARAESERNTGMTLNIAFNYGGREELVRAARHLAKKAQENALDWSQIDEAALAGELYTAGQPDPDLIIRPSGEQRLSNFLLWQCAYAELVFFNVLWPDFTPADLDAAIDIYRRRDRRFGGI